MEFIVQSGNNRVAVECSRLDTMPECRLMGKFCEFYEIILFIWHFLNLI